MNTYPRQIDHAERDATAHDATERLAHALINGSFPARLFEG